MSAGPEPVWDWPNGAKAAVSITYDGGDRSHIEFVAPFLEKLGLPATFFVPGGVFVEEVQVWRDLKSVGHEIGNGALCDWFGWTAMDPSELEEWINEELKYTDLALTEALGMRPASIAVPWVQRNNLNVDAVCRQLRGSEGFVRTGVEGFNDPFCCDLRHASCIPCDGFDDSELLAICQAGVQRGAWIVFSFCGIGVGEPSVDRHAHDALVEYLHDHKSLVWTATFDRVATHIGLKR